jgi:hypothetical protein
MSSSDSSQSSKDALGAMVPEDSGLIDLGDRDTTAKVALKDTFEAGTVVATNRVRSFVEDEPLGELHESPPPPPTPVDSVKVKVKVKAPKPQASASAPEPVAAVAAAAAAAAVSEAFRRNQTQSIANYRESNDEPLVGRLLEKFNQTPKWMVGAAILFVIFAFAFLTRSPVEPSAEALALSEEASVESEGHAAEQAQADKKDVSGSAPLPASRPAQPERVEEILREFDEAFSQTQARTGR